MLKILHSPHPLSEEQLKKLSTQRLLQVLKVARQADHSLYCGCCQEPARGLGTEEEWNRERNIVETYITNIKNELASREHVPRKE